METYINGKIVYINEKQSSIILENNFKGYYIKCVSTSNFVKESYAKIYIGKYTDMRGNEFLYGFDSWKELIYFNKLLKVKYIGPVTIMKLFRNPGIDLVTKILESSDFYVLREYDISSKIIDSLTSSYKSKPDEKVFLSKDDKVLKDKRNKIIFTLTKIGYKKTDIVRVMSSIDILEIKEEEVAKMIIRELSSE